MGFKSMAAPMYSKKLRRLIRPQIRLNPLSLLHLATEKAPLRRIQPPSSSSSSSSPHRLTTEIADILRTSDDDTWRANEHLNQLLFSNFPPLSSHHFLQIARQLGNSTSALKFFHHLRASSPPPEPTSLSSTFQAVFELASREPDSANRVLDLLSSSKEFSVPLTISSAITLIRGLGRAKMADEAMRVYNELDSDARDTCVRNAIVGSLMGCSRIRDALQVLDEMLQPDSASSPNGITADIVFAGLLRKEADGRSVGDEEIVQLFWKFGERGVFPDSVVITQIITMLCSHGKSDKGWKVLHAVMKSDVPVEAPPCNALLTWLARGGEVEKMNLLMKEMKEKGITPNAVTFGIVINSLCKTSRLDQALAVLEKIKQGDDGVVVKPDVVIYNTVINGLCKAGRQDEGLALMERMESEGQCVPNTVTYNCLIDGFCKAGELDKAQELFVSMSEKGVQQNIRTVNALIGGMCWHGKIGSALKFFDRIKDQGLKWNEATYTILIGAFCNVNNIGRAMELFEEMRQKFTPDSVVYYTLISGLSQAGRMNDACSIVEEMKTIGLSLDVKCYNILINGFCKKKMTEKAIELLMEMEAAQIKPDAVTYNTLIAFFSQVGYFSVAHRLLKKMLKDGLKPTVVTFGALIRAYCSVGDLEKAMKIFRDMNSSSVVPPNTIIYNTLIDSLCKTENSLCKTKNVEDALSLLDDMEVKHVRPSTNTFNSLFKGLQEMNQLDKAFELMDRMTAQACNPDYITMEVLTDWLSAVGETAKLRKFVQGYKVSATLV